MKSITEPLAVVTRNGNIESIHYGIICVVNPAGEIMYHLGDYRTRIYFRSSAKPIQVIPFMQSGAASEYLFSQKELAIACASHSGQKIHQSVIKNILDRLNLEESNLHCGIMNPYSEEESRRLLSSGETPSVLHCSCSGKHTAMVALSKYRGYGIEDYEKRTHPVQKEILETIAEFTQESIDTIPVGTDGCGVPIYLIPMNKIALSYAKLVDFAQNEREKYHNTCKTIFESMTTHPEMIAGDGEFCTELMQATNGKLIGKVGCEAVYCLGIKKHSLGICIKIADGNERAVYPVVIQVLRDLGILNQSEFTKLEHWYRPVLKNNRQEEIGRILPIFSLKTGITPQINLGDKIDY